MIAILRKWSVYSRSLLRRSTFVSRLTHYWRWSYPKKSVTRWPLGQLPRICINIIEDINVLLLYSLLIEYTRNLISVERMENFFDRLVRFVRPCPRCSMRLVMKIDRVLAINYHHTSPELRLPMTHKAWQLIMTLPTNAQPVSLILADTLGRVRRCLAVHSSIAWRETIVTSDKVTLGTDDPSKSSFTKGAISWGGNERECLRSRHKSARFRLLVRSL